LLAYYDLKRVNHQNRVFGTKWGRIITKAKALMLDLDVYNTVNAHKLGTLYLSNYANEIAYREDTRRLDNKAIMDDILSRCLADNSISNEFCGYFTSLCS